MTKARAETRRRYTAKAIDKISFDTPKGTRAVYKAAAQACGLSLMGMIRIAVEEFINAHTVEDFLQEKLTAGQKLLAKRFGKLPPETQKIVLSLVCNAEKVANKGATERHGAEFPATIRTPIEEIIANHIDVELFEEPAEEEPAGVELSEQEQLLLARFNRLPQATKDVVLDIVDEAARVTNKGAVENDGEFAPLENPAGVELSAQEQLLLTRFGSLPQATKDVVLNLVGEAARVANKGAA